MALISNEAQDEQKLTFKTRDVIKIDYGTGNFTGYYRNGYRYGMLFGTNKIIKFPNFKMEKYVEKYRSLAFD